MKVALIGSAHPFRGGLASYNERLMKEFKDQGHEVKIFTFTVQYPNFLFPGKTQFSSSEAPKDLEIERCVNSVNPLNWIQMGMRLKKEKYDLVIIKYWLPFMGPCFGTIGRILKGNKRTKVITIVDNMIPHEKRIGDIPFTKYYAGSSDAFLAMSDSVLKDVKTFEADKPLTLNPHPIFDNFGASVPKEEACKQLGLDPSVDYMLFFGFIRKYKGLDLLLEAMADERIKAMNVKLVVAGEYYQSDEEYRAIIDKHNLADQLVLANNFIADEEVATYFGLADIVVQPYKSATQSGVTQIAYHFDKPMIVTNVGGLPELVPNDYAGYVVDVDVKALADSIVQFYAENKKEVFTANVREEKKKYSWETMYHKLLELKEQIR